MIDIGVYKLKAKQSNILPMNKISTQLLVINSFSNNFQLTEINLGKDNSKLLNSLKQVIYSPPERVINRILEYAKESH